MSNSISANTVIGQSTISDLIKIKDILNEILGKTSEINSEKLRIKTDKIEIDNLNKKLASIKNDVENKISNINPKITFESKFVQDEINKLESYVVAELNNIEKIRDEKYKKLDQPLPGSKGNKYWEKLPNGSFESTDAYFREQQKIDDEINRTTQLRQEKIYKATQTLIKLFEKSGQEIKPKYKEWLESLEIEVLDSDFGNRDFFAEQFNAESADKATKIINSATQKIVEAYREQGRQESDAIKSQIASIKEAYQGKIDELYEQRDVMVRVIQDLLTPLKEIGGDDSVLNIDLEKWTQFNSLISSIITLLSGLNVDTTPLDNLLESVNDRVYISKGSIEKLLARLAEVKGSAKDVSDEIHNVENVSDTVSFDEWLDINRQLEDAQREIVSLEEQIENLESSLASSVDWFAWDSKCEKVEKLTLRVSELESEIENLKNKNNISSFDNNTFKDENKELQSLDRRREKTEEVATANNDLVESEKELRQVAGQSSQLFDLSAVDKFNDILALIAEHLNDIKTALGNVNDSKGVKNLIQTFDTLLTKLDNIREKIGTGIYNVEINQGNFYGSNTDKLIDKTLSDLRNRYEKVVSVFGNEENLYSRFGARGESLRGLYSRDVVNAINDPKIQIDKIREFFKDFRELRELIQNEIIRGKNELDDLFKRPELKKTNITQIKNKAKENTKDLNPYEKEAYNRYIGIKEQESVLSRLNKITAPAKNNARLNTNIQKLQDAEIEEYNRIQELSKTDLSSVIDSLTRIENLLQTISTKEFFNEESLNSFITALDNIVSKIDNITVKTKEINPPVVSNNKANTHDSDGIFIYPTTEYEYDSFNDDIEEYCKDILPEEEKLEQVSSKVAKKIADDFGATGKAIELLKEEVKELLTTMQSGEEIDLSNLVNILKQSPGVLDHYKKNYDQWYSIRDYVSNSKIKTSSYDAEEFGDEWNKVRATIGINVLNNKTGTDAETFIKELTGVYGNFLGEVNNTQDALRKLYEFLDKRPNLIKDFENDLNNGLIQSLIDRLQAGSFGIDNNLSNLKLTAATQKKPIVNSLTGKEISQEAYDILDRLEKGADVTLDELNQIPEIVEGFHKLDEITNAFIEKYRDLGVSIKDTSDLQTEERQALRDYIISLRHASGSFSGKDVDGDAVYNGAVNKERKAVIVTGLPASGKSSSLVDPLSQYYGAKVIDSDIIKELIPEFNKGWGAKLVHEESSELNKRFLNEVLTTGENVIIPIVGQTVDKVVAYIDKLKDAGYEVELALNELPNDEATKRNLLRFFNDGRFLDPGLVREKGNMPSEAFDILKYNDKLSGYYKFNNNVAWGKRPELIESNNVSKSLIDYLLTSNVGRNKVSYISKSELEIQQVKQLNALLERRRELLKSVDDIDGTDYDKVQNELSRINSEISNIIGKKQELTNETPSTVAVDEASESISTEGEIAEESARKKQEFIEANKQLAESGEETSIEIPKATEAIINEGNAAEEATKKKDALTEANNNLANSGKNIGDAIPDMTAEIKSEGDAAKEAANKLDDAGDALERYIRRQRGEADSGNYNFTQAINKVVDKDIQVRTDDEGNETRTETLRVNYDKLSKEILKTDTEIFKLQQQINNTTQGNTSGLQKNLLILENQKKVYEDLLNEMVSNPEYEIDASQIRILEEQRVKNQQWLQNIQDTKDSIAQLKANAASISLGYDVEIKNNELTDYVDRLKDLGVYSQQAEKEANRLSQVLSHVTNKSELSDYVKQFKIFQQDMASAVDGNKGNLNSAIREQVTAYKNIWNIRKQIAKLDTNKDANLIAELKTQEKEQIQIYATKTNEIKAINRQVGIEQVLINKATIRKKTEEEIRNIKASQSDIDVKTRFDSIISKYKEIRKLNSEKQGLISAGVSSADRTVNDRENAIAVIEKEIKAIKTLGFTKEQLDEIDKARASSMQVIADAQAKQAARGALEVQQIEKTRVALKKQASELLNNGKLMRVYGTRVDEILKELGNTSIAKDRLEELRIELSKIKTEANLAGNSGKTFGQILKQRFTSLGAYIGTFTSFYRIIGGVRKAFSTVTELDTQLVDLRKTTKMNNDELEAFYQNSNNIARQLGVTTSEIISQAAAWSRLNKIGHLCGNI